MKQHFRRQLTFLNIRSGDIDRQCLVTLLLEHVHGYRVVTGLERQRAGNLTSAMDAIIIGYQRIGHPERGTVVRLHAEIVESIGCYLDIPGKHQGVIFRAGGIATESITTCFTGVRESKFGKLLQDPS